MNEDCLSFLFCSLRFESNFLVATNDVKTPAQTKRRGRGNDAAGAQGGNNIQ